MRKGVSIAAGLALVAALSFGAAPAQAVPISAPAALKGASNSVLPVQTVSCWDCGYGPPRYYQRPYYRPYYRPHYRPYYRPYVRHYYEPRPYYRPYVRHYEPRPYYYRPVVRYYEPPRYYRPYAPPPWVSGPYFIRRYYY